MSAIGIGARGRIRASRAATSSSRLMSFEYSRFSHAKWDVSERGGASMELTACSTGSIRESLVRAIYKR